LRKQTQSSRQHEKLDDRKSPALYEGKLDNFGVGHDRNSEWWQPLADIPGEKSAERLDDPARWLKGKPYQ